MNAAASEARINAMLRRDILVGIVFATLMWLAVLFTLFCALRVIDDTTIKIVLTVAALVLGIFNTLSLLSLIRRYRMEREHVYGEDIHYLDAARAARRARSGKAVADEVVAR